ncbi:MAG TPA: hypothetical protein VLA88_06135, partial [Candidatus Saccharimonadales bacterium]|nr:hypothetical protein [Candidatus Saccharimonadales bacterium]
YAEGMFLETAHTSDKAPAIVNAQLGTIFMPACRARFAQERLSARAIGAIHTGVADILGTFDERYDPKGLDKYAGTKPELVTLSLFARLGSFDWLAYPASPREETNSLIEFNHDSYVIRGDIKVPVQVKRKSGHKYDPTVAVVRFYEIMQRVNEERRRRTVQLWGNKRRPTKPLEPLGYNDFADLIVREAKGQWLSEHEAWLLELGSMAAVTEVMKKEQIIQNQRGIERMGGLAIAA